MFIFVHLKHINSFRRINMSFVYLSIGPSSKRDAFVRLPALANASVHSLPFFLIVIYIAIRKFIFSLSAVSDVNFSSWLVVM